MMSFEDICGEKKRPERPFLYTYDQDEINGDEDYEDYFHQPEKKRRLTLEQVQFLEKSFEVENKLEPERKVQLAKELGLQPRQVAIWFQNRRARWKTKQLERDFHCLQSSYDRLKADYESLLQEKHKLQAEVIQLTDKLFLKDKTQENHSETANTYVDQTQIQEEPITESGSETDDPRVSFFTYKPEDLCSTKSVDSDSSQYLDVTNNSTFGDPRDSFHAIEADNSDLSQDDDEEYLRNSLLNSSSSHVLLKIADVEYSDPPSNSCNYGFNGEDHASLLWPYWDINHKM